MKSLIIIFIVLISSQINSQTLPQGFSYVSEIDATIKKELRYSTSNNFIGQPIDGYIKDILIISTPAAKALKKIQTKLMLSGLSLKIFDAYRPQQAVDHFVRWAEAVNDTLMKQYYYPDVKKLDLFRRGFIASKSGHTRGSTVDLSIVDVKTNKAADLKDLEPDDLVKYGMIPEFVGRFPTWVGLTELTVDQLIFVLTEIRNSLVAQYTYLFKTDGVALTFSDAALQEIASTASKRKTGARSLQAELERILMPHMFSLKEYAKSKITEVKITPELVKTPQKLAA